MWRSRARIRWRHKDGREGIFEDDNGTGSLFREDNDEEWNDFIWTEGNYSCDCNRRMLFLDEDRDGCSEEEFEIISIEPIGEATKE